MGFLDLIRDDDLDRLKICAADDCHGCAGRSVQEPLQALTATPATAATGPNVAAYRARKRRAARGERLASGPRCRRSR